MTSLPSSGGSGSLVATIPLSTEPDFDFKAGGYGSSQNGWTLVGNAVLSEVTQARFIGGELEVDWTGIGGAQPDYYMYVGKHFEFPVSVLGNAGFGVEVVRSFYTRGGTTQRGDATIGLGDSADFNEWTYWDSGTEQIYAAFRVGTGGGAIQTIGAFNRAWGGKTIRTVVQVTPGFTVMKDAEVGVDTLATVQLAFHPTAWSNTTGLWGAYSSGYLAQLNVMFKIRQLAGSDRRIGFKVSELLLHGLGEPTNL